MTYTVPPPTFECPCSARNHMRHHCGGQATREWVGLGKDLAGDPLGGR